MARAKGQGLGREAEGVSQFRCGDTDYHRWRTGEVTVGGESLAVVSKPGVLSFGELDPSAGLLLDHVEVGPADTVCDLNCGAGVVGTLAALRAPGGRVWMADGNLLSVEAARRTLEANAVQNAEVAFSRGADAYSAAPADVAVVRLPKGKIPTLQLLWDAYHVLKPGGRCYLAGGNDEGIRTALRQMEALFGEAVVLGYRGGHRAGMATRPAAPAAKTGDFDIPWLDPGHFHSFRVEVPGGVRQVFSRPGVFSWDRLDRGSQALLEVMEVKGAERILELGCGYGVVGTAAAVAAPDARVTMVDVDVEAVRSSRRTADENGVGERCEVLASDAADAVADRRFDLLLTNPPFHVGKATDLDVPAQFIRDAARVLEPGGRLLLVANRTLPYEAWVRECFGAYRTVLDGREFKVLSAIR